MKARNTAAFFTGFLAVALWAEPGALAQKDDEVTFDADDVSKDKKKPKKERKKKRDRRGRQGDQPPPEPDPAAGEPEARPAPDEPEPPVEGEHALPETPEGQPEPEPEPGGKSPDEGVSAVEPLKADAELGDDRASWKDIVVVVRKPFLKLHRLELLPQWGITMNDNLIRHMQLNLQVNYYLTDILAVGVEGHLYTEQLREPFDLVGLQARRLPTVNKYNYGAALNFHYVPVYGKFAILDKHIIHWETAFTAGVGITESEVIPRDPRFAPFTNLLITPSVGATMRFFVTSFLTINIGVRDYIFVDKFEPANRSEQMFPDAASAKANADSSIINNVLFQAGIGFWFPPSFEYTTFR